MYAIVEIGGKQLKVEKETTVYVNRLKAEEGEEVGFDKILLVEDDKGNVTVGQPTVEDAKVTGKVLQHLKDDKVTVFKKKPRRGYRKKNGHRQYLTQLQIENIQK